MDILELYRIATISIQYTVSIDNNNDIIKQDIEYYPYVCDYLDWSNETYESI